MSRNIKFTIVNNQSSEEEVKEIQIRLYQVPETCPNKGDILIQCRNAQRSVIDNEKYKWYTVGTFSQKEGEYRGTNHLLL